MKFLSCRTSVVVLIMLCLGSIQSCSPSLNWRETRLDDESLVFLLPCKPDHGSRDVLMGEHRVQIAMVGCDADGSLFAVASASVPNGVTANEALQRWQDAVIKNVNGQTQTRSVFVPAGALAVPRSERVSFTGRRADGVAVQGQAAWFARSSVAGVRLFHAVIYAPRIAPEMADSWFASFRLP
jgi:hypothetical protein